MSIFDTLQRTIIELAVEEQRQRLRRATAEADSAELLLESQRIEFGKLYGPRRVPVQS